MPVALAGLLISVEPLIDMGRTALNVSGSMTSGLVTSKVTNELEKTRTKTVQISLKQKCKTARTA